MKAKLVCVLGKGDPLTQVKIIFHDVKDEDKQKELLNRLFLENNILTENIKFISATKEFNEDSSEGNTIYMPF